MSPRSRARACFRRCNYLYCGCFASPMRYLLLVFFIVASACLGEEDVAPPKVLPVDFSGYALSCSEEGVVQSVRLQVRNTGNISITLESLEIGGDRLISSELPLSLGVGQTRTVTISPVDKYIPGFTSLTTRTASIKASGPEGNFTKEMVFKGTRCP